MVDGRKSAAKIHGRDGTSYDDFDFFFFFDDSSSAPAAAAASFSAFLAFFRALRSASVSAS